MKKLFYLTITVFAFATLASVFLPKLSSAQTEYTPLAPIPGTYTKTGDSTVTTFQTYANGIILAILGVATVLAVILVVIGGIKYMTTSSTGSKGAAKEVITNAVIGLLIIMSSWLILYTINPDILNIDFIAPDSLTQPKTYIFEVESISRIPGNKICGSTTITQGARNMYEKTVGKSADTADSALLKAFASEIDCKRKKEADILSPGSGPCEWDEEKSAYCYVDQVETVSIKSVRKYSSLDGCEKAYKQAQKDWKTHGVVRPLSGCRELLEYQDKNPETAQKYEVLPTKSGWYIEIYGWITEEKQATESPETFYYGPFATQAECLADKKDPNSVDWIISSSCVQK